MKEMGNIFDTLIAESSLRVFFRGNSFLDSANLSLTFIQREPPIQLNDFGQILIKVTELARKQKIGIENQIREIVPSKEFNVIRYSTYFCLLFLGNKENENVIENDRTFGFLIGRNKTSDYEVIGIWPPEKASHFPDIRNADNGKEIIDQISRAISHPTAFSEILLIS